jgi:hypothetical protein
MATTTHNNPCSATRNEGKDDEHRASGTVWHDSGRIAAGGQESGWTYVAGMQVGVVLQVLDERVNDSAFVDACHARVQKRFIPKSADCKLEVSRRVEGSIADEHMLVELRVLSLQVPHSEDALAVSQQVQHERYTTNMVFSPIDDATKGTANNHSCMAVLESTHMQLQCGLRTVSCPRTIWCRTRAAALGTSCTSDHLDQR